MNEFISKIGFGTWAIGGDSYGYTDDNISIKALKYAFYNGVNFFDTADLYGKGHSEKLLGKAFKKNREEVIIASKVGYDLYGFNNQIFTPEYITASIENSLKRLKTDYLDIFFLHSPPRKIIDLGEAYFTLKQLKEKGKIKQIGISIRNIDDGIFALKKNTYDAIQFIFNLLDQRAKEIGLLDFCLEKNILTVARVPLCFGFLTCKYDLNTIFPENDHRHRWSIEQRNKWIYASNKFRFLFSKYGFNQSMASLSLKYCCSSKGISTVIPGMKTVSQVKENLMALKIKDFNENLKSEIDTVYKKYYCIPDPV